MNLFLKSSLLSAALALGSVAFAQQPGTLQSDGTTAPAQTQPAPHQRKARHDLKHLTALLGLTADQSTQLQPILADRDTKLNTLATDTTLDPKSKHKQMHQINRDAEAKMSSILTPAQQQQFADMKAAHHHHKGQPMPPPTA